MNPNITKIIDQYLNNELSEVDKINFEKRLNTNAELRAEVKLQSELLEGIQRAGQRSNIKKLGKNYHLSKFLKPFGISLGGILILTITGLLIFNPLDKQSIPNTTESAEDVLIAQLDSSAQFDNLPIQYFSIPDSGGTVLSKKGVLFSVPVNAFLLNGQAYKGNAILQIQEALEGSDIIKSGLSTKSGDRLLETQGMLGITGFTPEGIELEFNPEVGLYVQVPVEEYKEGMQLFDGVKNENGVVDWQNPKPLYKIPVPIPMSELDFYPEYYEALLDSLQWKKERNARDSLYLSFESYGISRVDTFFERPIYIKGSDITETKADTIINTVDSNFISKPDFISPSKVLAFWNNKFDKTNLATRAFEKRLRAIHRTCDNEVLEKYTSQLDRPISQIDAEIEKMGYPDFSKFAAENIGAIDVSNPHLKNLQRFYEMGIEKFQTEAQQNRDRKLRQEQAWDKDISEERQLERQRSLKRKNQLLTEEYNFNLKNVAKQLNRSVGFLVKKGGGTMVNIDKYVMDATITRKTTTIKDPVNGKTATISYNNFSIRVTAYQKYPKLYAYLLPHQLHSYHRIDHQEGNLKYPLNGDITYDLVILGINENGYHYFQKQRLHTEDIGEINLESISERRFEALIKQLNKERINAPVDLKDELRWLSKESQDYKVQKRRRDLKEFRSRVAQSLSPCLVMQQLDYPPYPYPYPAE